MWAGKKKREGEKNLLEYMQLSILFLVITVIKNFKEINYVSVLQAVVVI